MLRVNGEGKKFASNGKWENRLKSEKSKKKKEESSGKDNQIFPPNSKRLEVSDEKSFIYYVDCR